MAKLFISYRREDTQYQADRLHAAIRPHVPDPARDIFIDIDNIPLGVNFAAYLDDKVSQCEVLLALIGPNWLEASSPGGQRRLDEPADFVRIEIASALQRGIPVVPVLFDGAPVPHPDQLPEDLKELSLRHGVEIRRATFEDDAIRLVRGLGLIQPDITPAAPPSDPNIELQVMLEMAEAEADLLWEGMQDSFDPGEYAYFLDVHPDHNRAAEAASRLRQLEGWHQIKKSDPVAIETFRQNAGPLFPVLEAESLKQLEQAQRSSSVQTETATLAEPSGGRSKLYALLAGFALIGGGTGLFATGIFSRPEAIEPVEDTGTDIPPPPGDTALGSGELYDVVETLDTPAAQPGTVISGKGTAADVEAEDQDIWLAASGEGTASALRAYLAAGQTRFASYAEADLAKHEASVARLQRALNAKGFDAGTADGIPTQETLDAVAAFRSAENGPAFRLDLDELEGGMIDFAAERVEAWVRPLPESQTAAPQSGSATNEPSRNSAEPAEAEPAFDVPSRESIKLLQAELRNLGYYTSRVDGSIGSGTRRAIQRLNTVSSSNFNAQSPSQADVEAMTEIARDLFSAVPGKPSFEFTYPPSEKMESINSMLPLPNGNFINIGGTKERGLYWADVISEIRPDATVVWKQDTFLEANFTIIGVTLVSNDRLWLLTKHPSESYFTIIELSRSGEYLRRFRFVQDCVCSWDAIAQGHDNEVVLLGSRTEDGVHRPIIVQLNSRGQVSGEIKIVPPNDTFTSVSRVIPLANGQYVGTGYSTDADRATNSWVFKFDQRGQTLWSVPFENFSIRDVIQHTSGNLFIAIDPYGRYDDPEAQIVRLDQNGNVLNRSQQLSFISQLLEADNGGVLALGYTTIQGNGVMSGYNNGYAARLDRNLNLVWSRAYGGIDPESFSAGIRLSSGEILAGGFHNVGEYRVSETSRSWGTTTGRSAYLVRFSED